MDRDHKRNHPSTILFALSSILLFISTVTAQGNELPKHLDDHNGTYHSSWSSNGTRWDFVFSPKNITADVGQLQTLVASGSKTLAQCTGQYGCLIKGGELLRAYNSSTFTTGAFIFTAPVARQNSQPGQSAILPCKTASVKIDNFCSTHWNPPIHITGNDCVHLIDWNSPYACTEKQIHHEQIPCYVHDPTGKLIDLTHLVLSNGSSYEVDIGLFNTTIKEFHLNVCNVASEKCGPKASSCRYDDKNHVETGSSDLTSISYNTTEESVHLISLGEKNEKCADKRVKTIVKFSCPKQFGSTSKPKLVEADDCLNVIDWPTVQACPVPDIQADIEKCAIKYEPLGIDINLREIFVNQSLVEIPDVNLGGKNKTMLLGLCKGISPSTYRCAGKSSSGAAACLIEEGGRREGTAKNSEIVGQTAKLNIKLADSHLFLESFAKNKTCEVPVTEFFNYTRQVGTRVEVVCAEKDDLTPQFVTFEDCVYVFRWGSSKLCLENMIKNVPITKPVDSPSTPKSVITPLPSTSPVPMTNHTENNAENHKDPELAPDTSKTAHDMHKDTVADSKDMLKPEKPAQTPTPKPTVIKPEPKKETINGQTVQPISKMNKTHKFFMIGLIVMSLTAFVVVIFVLDRKTNFKIPLGRIGRRARQALRPQPMPYTRVSFNDNLDL